MEKCIHLSLKIILPIVWMLSFSIGYGQINGSLVVFPGDTVEYSTTIPSQLPCRWQFSIRGGVVIDPPNCTSLSSCRSDTITVVWDNNPNNTHSITLYYIDLSQPLTNCSPQRTIPVTMVSRRLVAGPIYGNDIACVGATGLTYHIDPVPTADGYQWSITGGQITSGNGSTSITVNWNVPGKGMLTVFPHNALVGDGYPGQLDVYVYPSLNQPPVSDLSYGHINLIPQSLPRSIRLDHCNNFPSCASRVIEKATLFAELNLGENYNYGTNSFSTEADFVIIGYGEYFGVNSEVMRDTVHLQIDQQHPEQLFFRDITDIYPQIARFDVIITGYTPHSLVQDDISLKVYYQEKFKTDAQSLTTPLTINPVNTSPTGTHQLTFQWNSACIDFPNYELQLLRLYNINPSQTNDPTHIRASVNWHQALTIETQSSATSLPLSVVEGSGYYVWRVRPIGNYYEGGIANPKNWGAWSNAGSFTQNSTVNVNAAIPPHCFYYNQFDEDINWIYSRIFTEGNIETSIPIRRREQIGYANRLNQMQQQQIHLETDNITLVSHTGYDFSGRPALQSMAVPVTGKRSLGYETAFMKNTANQKYTSEDFDADNNFNQPGLVRDVQPADNFSYYSNNNPDINIPTAEGYPFTRTLFYGDGTDRIKEQSSPGVTHTIKASPDQSRTVKTYYAGVTDDELIRVFGDEAPASESVQKIITLDPNRVATVTYLDKDGKTLATSLGINGENNYNDTTSTLNGLASQQEAVFRVSDTLSGNTSWGTYGYQTSKNIVIVEPTMMVLNYQLTPNTVEDICASYCSTCDYYVEFMVQDIEEPEAYVLYDSLRIAPVTCTDLTDATYTTSVFLDVGSYVVTKRIRAANIDPATQAANTPTQTYLAEHLDSLRNYYTTLIQSQLGTVNAMLHDPNADLAAIYNQLGIDINIDNAEVVFQDSVVMIPVGCDTLEIPVLVCQSRPCPPQMVDFENYFLQIHGQIDLDVLFSGSALMDFDNFNDRYGNGQFNELVNNMMNDGYHCDSLWLCWERIVQNYDTLVALSQRDTTYTFDLIDEFLNCAGRRIEGFTNVNFGTDTNPGYLSHAYKVFEYTAGANPLCENAFCHPSNQSATPQLCTTADFTGFDASTWEQFYQCVRANENPHATLLDAEEFTENIADSCQLYCEYRREGFVNSIVRMFHNDSLYVEDDLYFLVRDASWGQTFVPDSNDPLPVNFNYDVSWSEVLCMASSLVEHCKQGCILTPEYDSAGNLLRVGTDEEIDALKQSLTYGYEIRLPDENGVCADSFAIVLPIDTLNVPGSTGIQRQWDITLGALAAENRLWDMQRTGDGGYILAGSSQGNATGDKSQPSRGSHDYWLVKTDSLGQQLWDVTIGGAEVDQLHSVQQTADGGYILGGESRSVSGGDKSAPHFGSYDYWLVKVSSSGVIQWQQSYGGDRDDRLRSVRQTADGGFILGGYSNSGVSGNKTIPQLGAIQNSDFWIVKVNATGNIAWQRVYGTTSRDYLQVIRQTSDGGYIAGGHTTGNRHPAGGKSENSLGDADYWVIKLDANGHRVWDNTMGGAVNDFLFDLEQTRDQGYILAGGSNSHQGADKSQNSFGESDYWVVKLDAAGEVVWDKTLGGPGQDAPDDAPHIDVIESTDGGYVVGGLSRSDRGGLKSENTFDNPAQNLINRADFWVVKTDVHGEVEWDKTIGGQGEDYFTVLAEIGEDCFTAGGFSQSPNNFLPSCGNNCEHHGWKSQDRKGNLDYWITSFCQLKCDHRNFCFRWQPVPEVDSFHVILPYTCDQVNKNLVTSSLEHQVYELVDAKVNEFEKNYTTRCADPANIRDKCWLTYELGYHHYMLYYYDRANNLIKTVPPKGVQRLDVSDPLVRNRQITPTHSLVTDYEYNSLGQLVRQHTPDGGETHFYYNRIGQLRFSQNAQQQLDSVYTYTKYDNLGRIIEVGESSESILSFAEAASLNNPDFPSIGTQKTFTMYTQPADTMLTGKLVQRYLTNRISYVYTDEGIYTIYSYDPHGNVEWLLQRLPGWDLTAHLAYEYDLVSGNVLKVKYNEGKADQLYTRYTYDADNRIVMVETSTDGVIWDRDVQYQYYAHGPLQRVEVGEDQLQGMDYTYTIQGWLKGMNHASLQPTKDPGRDGISGAHSEFGADVFGMQLGYHAGDFNRSGSAFHDNDPASLVPATNRSLYDGNISTWAAQTSVPASSSIQYNQLTGQQFRYDELNRLLQSNFQINNGNSWNPTPSNDYYSAYQYDANGNIETLTRHGYSSQVPMDNLSYTYQPQTNRLAQVSDVVPTTNYDNDLDGINSYTYDALGNLVSDPQEEIDSIQWTVYGKVRQVARTPSSTKPDITFMYDGVGNRVIKKVIPDRQDSLKNVYTYYVRDPQGNVMAVYKKSYQPYTGGFKEVVSLEEQPIYGSSRVGEHKESIVIDEKDHPFHPPTAETPRTVHDRVWVALQDASGVAGFIEVDMRSDQPKISPLLVTYKGAPGKNLCMAEDQKGNRLFTVFTAQKYQDRENVCLIVNRKNQLMPGSEAIISDGQKKSLVMQKPGDPHSYYLFTIDQKGRPYIHLIDMAANEGLGAITSNINKPLDTKAGYGQGMALIEDHRGTAHSRLFLRRFERGFCSIISFEITKEGIGDPRIMVTFKSNDAGGEGEIQIAPDGTQLAVANRTIEEGQILLYDLSPNHGKLSLIKAFRDDQKTYATSLDFSPSGEFIFYNSHPLNGNDESLAAIKRLEIRNGKTRVILQKISSEIRRTAQNRMLVASGQDNTLYVMDDPDGNTKASGIKINQSVDARWRLAEALPLQVHRLYPIFNPPPAQDEDEHIYTREIGKKWYEINDHLGNVRAVINDIKSSTASASTPPHDFRSTLVAAYHYYPFGMLMPGREWEISSGNYRFGFNSMERDDEINGEGNSYSTLFRQYDPRVVRWWSKDPKSNAFESPYVSMGNNPTYYTDPNGDTLRFWEIKETTTLGPPNSEGFSQIKTETSSKSVGINDLQYYHYATIRDLREITGLDLFIDKSGIIQVNTANSKSGILEDAQGKPIGSQLARETLLKVIQSPETVYAVLDNSDRANSAEYIIHIGAKSVEDDMLDLVLGRVNPRTFNYGITFLHELLETKPGGSLRDPGIRGYPSGPGILGESVDFMNRIREELGGEEGGYNIRIRYGFNRGRGENASNLFRRTKKLTTKTSNNTTPSLIDLLEEE